MSDQNIGKSKVLVDGKRFKGVGTMIHHYMTTYIENGNTYVESWLQIGRICFSRKRYILRVFNKYGIQIKIERCEPEDE